MKSHSWAWLVALSCVVAVAAHRLAACPFCTQTSKTLTEEMAAADVTVIAEIIEAPPRPEGGATGGGELPQATFRVLQTLKGKEHLDGATEVKAYFFGEFKEKEHFLITGMVLPNLEWSTPIPLVEESEAYVGQLLALPAEGADRLAFFQEYLENDDALLSRDAYDEFARAPYADLIALKDRIHHERLLTWIRDQETSPSHRRLYLTMLGVCGSQDDLGLLEEMLSSEDRKDKQALDALIACYLTLKGPDGMPMVEDLYLKNDEAEYADTYAAIMAIRFHGEQTDRIPRKRLLAALYHMLDRPKLADLVITDLSRWEDWSMMDRLVALFKDADPKNNWVRVPVVNYLQAAREQEGEVGDKAKTLIAELKEIDPKAVQQAEAYGAFGLLATSKTPPPGSQRPSEDQGANSKPETPATTDDPQADATTNQEPAEEKQPAEDPAPSLEPSAAPPLADTPDPETAADDTAPEERTSDEPLAESSATAEEAPAESDQASEPAPEAAVTEQAATIERRKSDNTDATRDIPAVSPRSVAQHVTTAAAVSPESDSPGMGLGIAVGIVIVFVTMVFSLGSGRP
ncbi:MAG: hypothetical protein KDA42_03565 [Planctomycetales bacterium]|nr:hypothetical protein [Planctomycetales bacterium]